MKKSIIASLLAFSLLLSAAGCSVTNESSDDTKSGAAQNSVSDSANEAGNSGENASKADVLEKTDFNLGYLNSTAHLLAFVAQEEGYFKDEGLNVTLTQFSSASELASGLESGKLDVAFIGSVPSLTFQSQGHDLTIFGGAMTNGHGYVIKEEYTKDLSSWDISILKGRNVASVKNSIQDAELQMLLKDAGIAIGDGDDKVNIVYFDSQKDAYAALQNKSIDAASVYSPYASLAKGQGYEVVYYCSDEESLKNQPCCRQVAATSALNENPNAYTAFERALIQAYKFSQENEDGTIQDVKKYIDIDEDYIRTEVYGGYANSSPDPDKQGTVTLKNTIVELGYTEDYDIEKYYNTDIYQSALESLAAANPEDSVYQSLQEHFEQYE